MDDVDDVGGRTGDQGMRRVRVVVSGRVQGVFFRATCAREAEDEGVSGWVRNRSDGRVEAVFEGRSDAVARMVAWARRGPPEARVDAAEVTEEPACGGTGERSRERGGRRGGFDVLR